ncbi:OmpA family protein [Roseateles sp. DAIF2]|uniref:OmpA family protein n=1 Tax=Roseateles sp. DAIF2 TaxID=2714952 RepID=UPI0018A314D4|nr:OmpA family protein [Roseateles sp. DAIF2]QPF73339.1 OmpA family protein [Roseateles sp. DAIF2]
MMRTATPVATLGLLAAALLASGCANMSERERGTAQGAGIGAVAGAVIGSATGGKAGQSALIGGAIGAVAGNLWSKHLEDKRRALEKASEGTGIEVGRTQDNRLKLNVPSDFSFDVGRADIKPQMRPVLDEIGRNLDPKVQVTVVGHTDSTGNDAINNPLSLERAESVRTYLGNRGVAPSRLFIEGRGSREPVASNDTDAGRAQNRRVEIFLTEPAG